MIELKNINITYDHKDCIIDGHFIAYPHQITGIYGESGTGKSSLLYMISIISIQQYDYYYYNEKITLNEKEKTDFRNKYNSYITQDSLLIETISVEKNILYSLMNSHCFYTVAVFVDNYNNILNVMNNISDKTNKTFVYSKYLSMQDIIKETKDVYIDALRIGLFTNTTFLINNNYYFCLIFQNSSPFTKKDTHIGMAI